MADDDVVTAADELLAANDDTLDRMWRYKALGETMGQIALRKRPSTVQVQLTSDDYRIVRAAATDKGISVNAYLRASLARCVMADYDLDRDDIASLARDLGAWDQ